MLVARGAVRGVAAQAWKSARGARASSSGGTKARRLGEDVPDLKGFMARKRSTPMVPRRQTTEAEGLVNFPRPEVRTFFLETYGCQMNEADTQIVDALLSRGGLERVGDAASADVLLMNTCAVREKAEDKIWTRLREVRAQKQRSGNRSQLVGVLGCMAERLKDDLLDHESLVNFIAGPDSYRFRAPRLPRAWRVRCTASPLPPLPRLGVGALVSSRVPPCLSLSARVPPP